MRVRNYEVTGKTSISILSSPHQTTLQVPCLLLSLLVSLSSPAPLVFAATIVTTSTLARGLYRLLGNTVQIITQILISRF